MKAFKFVILCRGSRELSDSLATVFNARCYTNFELDDRVTLTVTIPESMAESFTAWANAKGITLEPKT